MCYVWKIGEMQVQFLWVGKHVGKRPLGRSRCRWEDSIKIVLPGVGWDWIDCGSR